MLGLELASWKAMADEVTYALLTTPHFAPLILLQTCKHAELEAAQEAHPGNGFFSSHSLTCRHGMGLQAVDAHLPPHKLLIQAAMLAHPPRYPKLTPTPPTLPRLHVLYAFT